MVFPIIPEKDKRLCDVWDLRVAVLVSLTFQILLIFIASLRKRTGKRIVSLFIWLAYLLADWVATFAIGLIANGPGDSGKPALNDDVITFWASFLLVHLGGPHSITAFSLEDNELWPRHLLQLVIHLLGIAYVFSQSLPNDLWIPTILVYLAGLIKYVKRTRSLYLASFGTFKTTMLPPPSAGTNYARLMQVYRTKVDDSIPVEIRLVKIPEVEPPAYFDEQKEDQLTLTQNEVVQDGYGFFNDFKGLIVDLTYGKPDWEKTREFFFRRTAKDAFRIMEIELNFLYDLLYTKMVVVHSRWGFFFSFVCLASMVLALERFVSHHNHHNEIREVDIYITYTLLIGGIGLDVLGIIKLIFSDWTIVALKNYTAKFPKLGTALYAIRINSSFDKNYRWSKSLSQHSLITYCLKERSKWINKLVDTFGAKDFLDEFQYKGTKRVNEALNELIFKELREKARKAENAKAAKEICSWRGERVLSQAPRFCTSLAESVEVEYDESVLRWHVATELCYYETEGKDNKDRVLCKIMSQYMLYLLVMRPTVMSAVAGIVQIRFQDTCEEAKKFFRSISGEEQPRNFCGLLMNFFGCGTAPPMKPKEACAKLLQVDTVVLPRVVKGRTSKSVLFDACIMTKDLRKFDEKEMWVIMSKVWVELLSYAASHCRAYAHAQQLSKGGELITFIWLLMIRLGVGEQFRMDSTYNVSVSK